MKILWVLTQSLDSPSGLGRFGPIARAQAKRGCAVDIVALHPAFDTLNQTDFVDQGVHVHYVAQMHVRKENGRKTYFTPSQLVHVSAQATLALARAVATSDADIIQLGKPQPFNVAAALLGRKNRPIYCDCDDLEAATNLFGNKLQRRIVQTSENSVGRFARALTVNSRFLQTHFSQLGIPEQRITVVPNGYEQSRFIGSFQPQLPTDTNAPIVMYVGSLDLNSHPIDLLLHAFPTVLQQLPQAKLIIVGDGHDTAQLKQLAASLALHEQCEFLGRVHPDQVAARYQQATITVDPIHDDATARARAPLKLFESLACGTPVITSDVGDRRVWLNDGACGLLVPPSSADALADGIVDLLSAPEKIEAMSAAGVEHVRQYEWAALTETFMAVYDN